MNSSATSVTSPFNRYALFSKSFRTALTVVCVTDPTRGPNLFAKRTCAISLTDFAKSSRASSNVGSGFFGASEKSNEIGRSAFIRE